MNMERLHIFLSNKRVIGLTGLILVLISLWIYVIFTIDDSIYKYIFDVVAGLICGWCVMDLLNRLNNFFKGD
jgi:hypothetical protein